MHLGKQILRSAFMRWIAALLGALYIKCVYASNRWTVVREDIPRQFWDNDRPFILAFWHNRMLMMPKVWCVEKKFHMLISRHRDGLLISKVIQRFGLGTIVGSSSHGGTAALKRILSILRDGNYVGLTPDGPHGPRMRASEGIISIARLSGVPVIPVAYSVSRRRVLNSWDSFIFPWPIGSGVFVWGDPIEVPKDVDGNEQLKLLQHVEEALSAVAREADELTGQASIEPAPALSDNQVM